MKKKKYTLPVLPEALTGTLLVVTASDIPVRILFIEQVSALIGKSTTTIRTFATSAKYKHLIPRPFKMPGSRRLCWYEADVLAWIAANRPAEPPPKRRPRGRPTNIERQVRALWANGQQHQAG
jgi:predicted DNA-binding transcriptional regulator AlpA